MVYGLSAVIPGYLGSTYMKTNVPHSKLIECTSPVERTSVYAHALTINTICGQRPKARPGGLQRPSGEKETLITKLYFRLGR